MKAARELLAETRASIANAQASIASTMEQNTAVLVDARAAVDGALVNVAAALGDPEAAAELRRQLERERAANLGGKHEQPRPPQRRKAAWKRPNARARCEAARAKREKEIPRAFAPCPECFAPAEIPEVGEWLAEHDERGQPFRSFASLSMRPTPHAHVRAIELVVVGPWPADDDGSRAPQLSSLCRWCEGFFAGCTVRVAAERLPLAGFAANAREGMEGQLQICVGDVFDALEARPRTRAARDVLFSVAVTMCDVFPIEDGVPWNFVFGQARVFGPGVFSFARYFPGARQPLLWDEAKGVAAGAYDEIFDSGAVPPLASAEARALMLRRSCKVLTHEISHIFGVKHCIYYECLIAGCNHLTEFDKRPLFLCPVDMRKLHCALAFDVADRYRALGALCDEFGWAEDAAWIARRLSALG